MVFILCLWQILGNFAKHGTQDETKNRRVLAFLGPLRVFFPFSFGNHQDYFNI